MCFGFPIQEINRPALFYSMLQRLICFGFFTILALCNLNAQSLSKVLVEEDFVIELTGWDFTDGLPASYLPVLYPASSGELFLHAPKEGTFSFDGFSFESVPVLPIGHQDKEWKGLPEHVTFYENSFGKIFTVFQKYKGGGVLGMTVTDVYGNKPKKLAGLTNISHDSTDFFSERMEVYVWNEKLVFSSSESGVVRLFDGVSWKQYESLSEFEVKERGSQLSETSNGERKISVEQNCLNLYGENNRANMIGFREKALKESCREISNNLGLQLFGQPYKTSCNTIWWSAGPYLLRFHFRPKIFTVADFKDLVPSVRGIFPITDTTIYISTYSSDFVVASQSMSQVLKYKEGSVHTPVRKIVALDDSFLYGAEGGLFENTSLRPPVPSERINGIVSPSFVNDILLDNNGRILLATSNGLWDYSIERRISDHLKLKETHVYTIHKSAEAEIWLGTDNGVSRFKDGELYLEGVKVFHFLETKPGHFWLATDHGLIEWWPDKELFKLHLEDVVGAYNQLHCVYEDLNNLLWLSTNYGVVVYDPRQGVNKIFYVEDGLPCNEFNQSSHYQNDQGELFFGGVAGVAKVNPNDFYWDFSNKISPMVWKDVTVFDSRDSVCFYLDLNTYSSEKEIVIPSQSERVEIAFNFPNFDRDVISREWSITGAEQWWSIQGRNVFNFRFSDFGSKEVVVRSKKIGEVGLGRVLNLNLLKPVPFFKSKKFFLTSLIIVGFLVYLVTSFYQRFEKNRLRMLVSEKTKAIRLQAKNITHKNEELRAIQINRDRLFSNFSHDFRTPIFIINEVCAKALKEQGGERVVDRLKTIGQNAQVLSVLVEQISDLQSLDDKSVSLQKSWVNWRGLCLSTVDAIRPAAENKSIELSVIESSEEELMLWLDLLRTRQILQNLLDNAIKFTPTLGQVTFQTQISENNIIFKVGDSGPGVKSTEVQAVFARFEQGSAANKSEITGLGLGLSLCKDYIELMGGGIEVASSDLGGALFTVTLPREHPEKFKVKSLSIGPKSFLSSQALVVGGEQTILIAEDNPDLLRLYQETLSDKYSLLLAQDGKQALEFVCDVNVTIDLFIIDVMMPNMDGLEFVDELKNVDKYAGVPIIVISAIAKHSTKLRALRVGIDAFLVKPFSMEELQVRIINLTSYHEQRMAFLSGDVTKSLLEHEYADSALESLTPVYINEWLKRLEAVVLNRLSDPGLRISIIARELNVSERSLREKIKSRTGLKPSEYVLKIRLAKALELLQTKKLKTVAEVCYEIGMKSPSSFTKAFKKEFGRTPSSFFTNDWK